MAVIRPIEERDLRSVLAAERAFHTQVVKDPDFGRVKFVNAWMRDRNQVMDLIRQKGTRTVVIQSERHGMPWVCGLLIFEVLENRYEIIALSVHPRSDLQEAVGTALRYLQARAGRSKKRRRILYHIPDRDSARIRDIIPVFQHHGFTVRLAREHFGPTLDGWRCEYEAP